jgi:hypothetical protein
MDLRNNVPHTVFPYQDPSVPRTWLLCFGTNFGFVRLPMAQGLIIFIINYSFTQ